MVERAVSTPDFIPALRHSRAVRASFDELAKNGHLQRWAAAQACVQNPYQPFLVWSPVLFGHLMQLDLREEVGREIFVYGSYEPDLAEYLCRTLQPGQTMIDLGAHIGYFSILAGHLVGATGRVYAFEPIQETRAHLDTNVGIAKMPQVTIESLAAWSSAGEIRLNDFGVAWSAFNSVSGIRMPPDRAVQPTRVVSVPCVDLDSFCDQNRIRPDFIKIDVESAEYEVLLGMTEILTSVRPIVTIEVGDFAHLAAAGVPTSRCVLEKIASFGYQLFELPDGQLAEHSLRTDDSYAYENIVCIPREYLAG